MRLRPLFLKMIFHKMKINILRKPFKYTFFSASIILIIINCLMFFFTSIFPRTKFYLGLCPILLLKYKMIWQPLTYMFIHGSFTHLLSNMLGILFFGISLEKAIGSKEFLLMYLLCGFISGLCSFGFYILTGAYSAILIGASGALYAILFAFATVFPKANIYIWGILPIPSPILVIIYAGIELFSQFYGSTSNIAHFTHLFGFAAALLYFIIRMGINPFKIWKDAFK